MTYRFFAALSLLVCATANAKTIEGQVFIVTAGGPAIKLALVQVKAISKIEIANHIAKIEQQIAPQRDEANSALARETKEKARARQRMDGSSKSLISFIDSIGRIKELSARQKALNSAAPFFVDLPQPVATAKTDAEGHFQLIIPDQGEYVLVASAERTVLEDVERYFWIVSLNSEESKVMLSNDNLTASGSLLAVLFRN